jgi:prolyl oligopeptidase
MKAIRSATPHGFPAGTRSEDRISSPHVRTPHRTAEGPVRRAPFAALLVLATACSAPAPVAIAPPPPPPSAPPLLPPPPPSAAPELAAPPRPEPRPVTDTQHGVTLTDPFRWMEQPSSELDTLLAAETRAARRHLDALPERPALLARVRELSNAGVELRELALWKGTYVYLESEPGRDGRSLYARSGLTGVERRLIDSEFLGRQGARPAIESFTPSIDARYVAYAFSSGGASDGVLRLLQASNGAPLPDTLDPIASPTVAWQTDGRSFFYLRAPGAASPVPRIHLHEIGQDPASDPPVFGPDLLPGLALNAGDLLDVRAPPGSRWVFAIVRRGGRVELDLYAALAADLPDNPRAFTKIADADAHAAIAFDVHGDDLYLLSHQGAPRRRILRTSLSHPGAFRPSVLVPESDVVITALGVARDALYVHQLDHGLAQIRRVSFKGGHGELLPLPFEGSIPRWFVQPFAPGLLVQLGAPTVPPRFFAYDPRTKTVAPLPFVPPLPLDTSRITSTTSSARTADGTDIPLRLVFRSDLARDGAHPARLRALATHGELLDTTLRPTDLAWLERGGVVAFCHARGGGELGAEWHEAALRANKGRSVDDLLACAEALIRDRFSRPGRVAVEGEGPSLLLAAEALIRRPELFGAALLRGGNPRSSPPRRPVCRRARGRRAGLTRHRGRLASAPLRRRRLPIRSSPGTRLPPPSSLAARK